MEARAQAALGHAALRTFGDGSYARVLIGSTGHRPPSAPQPQAPQRYHRPETSRRHRPWPQALQRCHRKKAAEQQAIPLLIDLMSARGSAKKNKAVGSDGCPSEFWKYLSCVSMVVIFRLFLMRFLAMEDGRNVDSPH